MNPRLQQIVDKGSHLRKQMWKHYGGANTRRERLLYATMRVAAITWAGVKENQILIRAAGLSFSSLLGLGPMIALIVLVSGFVLDKTQPDMAKNTIENVISYIAPQVTLADPEESEQLAEDGLSEMVARFIEASQSGTVGVGGTLVLILIVIQLFITIEETFNDIWGVARGRKLVTRVILYWTVITLGTVLIFATIAVAVTEIIKLNTQFSEFAENITGTNTFGQWLSAYGAPVMSFCIMSGLLTVFYRFIPNTQVEWRSALIGAVFAVACIILNNTLAFLYIERVAMQRTLYGSLGILPVLMIGLYIFWLFLLIGGRISFAVQNARYRSGQVAWDELSTAAKEGLCLLTFTQICRQFKECRKALSTKDLADLHNLPRQLISAAVNRLCELGFVSALPPIDGDPFDAYRYQPAKPLRKISLIDFKECFETFGETPDEDNFDAFDPMVRHYHEVLVKARQSGFEDSNMESALEELDAKPQEPNRKLRAAAVKARSERL